MNKMERLLTAAAFAFALSAPQWAVAEVIVVLKAEQAMFATQKAILLGQQLSAQLKPQTTRYDSMGLELQASKQRFEADKDLMSSDEAKKITLEIKGLNNEHKQLKQYLTNLKVKAEQEFLGSMRPALDRVLRRLVEENNISLIINGQSVIYSNASIDITPKVIELLNLEP